MATTNEKIVYGVIGLVLLLAGGFGGSLLLSPDEFANAYVCSSTEKVGIFERLSSTAKTGYYTNELGEAKSSPCRDGTWIKLKAYAESKGIDPNALLEKSEITVFDPPVVLEPLPTGSPVPSGARAGAKEYLCSPTGCVEK